MPNIQVLSQEVADKIAAGEVAERPSAVVKELVENAIDAGATSIEVEIRKGGIEYIRVCDNGCGIAAEQAETAFLRHATSKLRSIDDLYRIGTMGFRGEALSSICAVAEVQMITRTEDSEEGIFLRLDHGKTAAKEPIACAVGTTMVVEKLFENIPARMKFLKKDSTEAGYVADVLGRIALSKPEISFTYICDGKEIFSTSGDGKLKNVILKLYGIDHAKAVLSVDYEEDNVRICGVVGKPELSRGNRTRQTLFVNGRYVKSHVASKIVGEAYRNSIMVGKFPFFVLDIGIAADCVDVNVHPAKTEIKFSNENRIYEIVYHAVSNALLGGEPQKTVQPPQEDIQAPDAARPEVSVSRSAPPRTEFTPARKTPSGGTGSGYAKPEKIDSGLVREYIDSVKPDSIGNKTEAQHSDGVIYSDFNFLEGKQSNLIINEVDEAAAPPVDETHSIEAEPAAEAQTAAIPIARPIGQLFDTYILCQADDIFYMIDQHAAHERLRFEELKKSYYEGGRMSQLLMTPMIIKPDYAEAQTILSNLDVFQGFGFEIEDFGAGSLIVNATPIAADEAEIRDLILEIADAVSDTGKHSVAEFEERALDMIACKYAIKANHRLNAAEMQDLLDKVWDMESRGIRTCPHGRPIRIEFSKADIEKLFKRRV